MMDGEVRMQLTLYVFGPVIRLGYHVLTVNPLILMNIFHDVNSLSMYFFRQIKI